MTIVLHLAAVLLPYFALIVFSSAAYAVSKTFTHAVSNDWFDANNWNPVGVPAATDDVTVNSGTLDLSGGDATVATYTHANGTLTGSGTLTVSGLMTWSQGIIRGTGVVNANGGLAMQATTQLTLTDTRTLNNAGLAQWTGASNFLLGGSAIFNNLEGGTFQIQTAADITSSGTFTNHGAVTKESGSGDGLTTVSAFVDDTGTVTVISGTLRFAGSGTHGGTLTVQPGAAFGFTAGTHTVTGSVSSPDTIGFSGGIITFENGSTYSVGTQTLVSGASVTFEPGAQVTLSANLEIAAGTLTLNSGTDFTVATYMHGNGTLTGGDDVTVTGPMTWERGIIRGTGVVNANGGLAMLATSTMTLTDTRTLNNAGVAQWTGPGAFSLGTNAIFNNLEGGTFQIATSADMTGGTFQNMGTLTKESGSGDGLTTVSSFVNDTGSLTVVSGTLLFSGSGTHGGALTVQPGAAFGFTAGTHTVTGSVSSPDTIGFSGGIITFENGSTYSVGAQTLVGGSANVTFEPGANVSLSANLEIDAGTLALNSGTDFTVATYTHANGTLTGGDDVTVTGLMTWERGIIRGTGVVNANGGLAMLATATMQLFDTRTLNNGGVAQWTGASNLSLASGAIFNNLEGGTFQIQTPGDMTGGTFQNMGAMTKESGSGDGVTAVSSSVFNKGGVIQIPSGSLALSNTYNQSAGATRLNGGTLTSTRPIEIKGGTLEGTGAVTGNVVVDENGIISPGLSAGSLQVTGNYTQDDNGKFKVEIGGTQAGTQFDLLTITGPATLGGAISAQLINGFTPSIGQTFQVMSFGSHNGDFDDDSGLATGGGFGFRKIVGNSDVTLQYAQEICDDQQDNDGDGHIDCDDVKCRDAAACQATPSPTASRTPTVTPTGAATPTATRSSTATAPAAASGTPTNTPTLTFRPTVEIECVGDCQPYDGVVTEGELILGTTIALAMADPEVCMGFDRNGDGAVTVDEIILGARHARDGCVDLTPTPTSATPTPTSVTPTRTTIPGGDPEVVGGATVIVANAMSLVPSIVAAIATGIEAGGAALPLVTGPAPQLATGACPLGGTALRSGSFPFVTITLAGCRVETASGTATYDGSVVISLSTLSVDIDMTFRDAVDAITLTGKAMLTGQVSPLLSDPCFLSAATLTINTGLLQSTDSAGQSAAVEFQNAQTTEKTLVVIDNITFNNATSCVPEVYRLTFTGPAALLSSVGDPIPVTFDGLVMNVDDSAKPTVFTLDGDMTSDCFGGSVSVTTNPSLAVPGGQLCPTAGTLFISGVPGSSTIFFRADASVDVDAGGDGTIDLTVLNCLDPKLFVCAGP